MRRYLVAILITPVSSTNNRWTCLFIYVVRKNVSFCFTYYNKVQNKFSLINFPSDFEKMFSFYDMFYYLGNQNIIAGIDLQWLDAAKQQATS